MSDAVLARATTARAPVGEALAGLLLTLPAGIAYLLMLLLPTMAAKREAAWKFLRFSTSAEGTALMVKNTGYVPVNQLAIDDDRYLGEFYRENPLFRTATMQAAFVAEALSDAGDRRLALFLHKPVFVTEPADPTFDYWSVPPHARASLDPVMRHPALRLVASGHLHLHRQFTRDGVAFAWAPPLSFVVNPAEQEGLPGERVCGALLHRLHDDHVETILLSPEGIETPVLDDIRHMTYPRPVMAGRG